MSRAISKLLLLACTALLAVGCAPAQAPARAPAAGQALSGAVPWVDRPAPAYVQPPERRPVADYPACRAWQLTGMPGRGGPAAGTVFQDIRLTNRSDQPCTLSGGPTAVIGATGGATTTLATGAEGASLGGPGPANLRPGQTGWVTLAYADGCPALTSGGETDYRTLFIALGGGLVRVEFRAALNLVCGLEVTEFGTPPQQPASSRSPLNVLTATVAHASGFDAGAIARYSVTVSNHTGAPVRLTPCPSYTEYLGVSAGPGRSASVVRHYYLNCAAVRRIPAHGSLTFEMRMLAPSRTGMAKLDWQFQDADVATAMIVTIRA
jgi:hypothetical protein